MGSITINKKDVTMGKHVRRAGESRISMVVSDRGQPVTVLAIPALWPPRRRTRTLWPEFAAMRARKPGRDLAADVDAVRCRPEP